MSRTILVHGDEKFQIEIPDDAELTFGPWSPPTKAEDRGFRSDEQRRGTLRVYSATKKQILAVFAGVTSFRDISQITYQKEIVQLKGMTTTIWESDDGAHKASTTSDERSTRRWVPELPEKTE